MKKFLIILLVLFIILIISIYMIYSYKAQVMSMQKVNKEYEKYYNVEIPETELVSIINRAIDSNIKNEVEKDTNQYYIDNEENSIQIYIHFIFKDGTKLVRMEDIEKGGMDNFRKVYSTASFKCTNIEYHEKTKNIESLTFEEVLTNN